MMAYNAFDDGRGATERMLTGVAPFDEDMLTKARLGSTNQRKVLLNPKKYGFTERRKKGGGVEAWSDLLAEAAADALLIPESATAVPADFEVVAPLVPPALKALARSGAKAPTPGAVEEQISTPHFGGRASKVVLREEPEVPVGTTAEDHLRARPSAAIFIWAGDGGGGGGPKLALIFDFGEDEGGGDVCVACLHVVGCC